VKSLGPYRERSGGQTPPTTARMLGAGAFTIRRLVLSLAGMGLWGLNVRLGLRVRELKTRLLAE
jgi:hypothetical protein